MSEPTDQPKGPPQSAAGKPPSSEPRPASLRTPLDEIKAPREWRSARPATPGEERPVPRAVKHILAASAAPPAGSQAPAASGSGSPVATYAPSEPVAAHQPPAAGELAGRYGVDRLVVLVRDPYWVYAWWELTESSLRSGREQAGREARLVLRVYDITDVLWDGHNHQHHFDLEVEDLAGNWYVELGRPGGSFCAELGLRALDGRFLPLLRSNIISLPRDSMSPIVDEEWMVVEEQYRLLFDLAGGGNIGLGSGEIQRLLEQRLKSELASGGVSSFGLSSGSVRKKPS